jgi:hypothetical protein
VAVNSANPTIAPEGTCLARVYSIVSVVNDVTSLSISPIAVSVNGPGLILTLTGNEAKYTGVHTVTIGVKLLKYPTVARYD